MTERQYKYKFKIQVPRDIPDIAIEDKLGRKSIFKLLENEI